MDTLKLKGIQDWPIPSTVKKVRGFLGFGNFYSQFIQNFSNIAHPLNDLLRKDKRFDWTQECQDAFENMKKQFTEELVLAMPDHLKPFQIESDASKYATGVVLSQLDLNGDRHLVVFYSKTFSPAEQNYDIHDKQIKRLKLICQSIALLIQKNGQKLYILWNSHTTINDMLTK